MLPELVVFLFACLPEWYSVGDSAKNAFHSNPENTVFDAKRLIGRKFDDPEIQRDMKHWPFKVVNKSGKPSVQVKYRGETREFVSCIAHSCTVPHADVSPRLPRRFPPWSWAR